MKNKRINGRHPFHHECFLSNGIWQITDQTFDISKMVAGLLINESIPFRKIKHLLGKIISFEPVIALAA